jgi:CP family cyanate transporter-like MFS transporter
VAGASALSGFAQGLGYAVAGTGPLVVGLLRELHGGWTTAFAFLLGGLLVQLLAALAVTRPGTLEPSWAVATRPDRAVGRSGGARQKGPPDC